MHRHKPEILQFYPDEELNLAYMVLVLLICVDVRNFAQIRREHRKKVLATVKWFGDIEESVEEKESSIREIDFAVSESVIGKSSLNRKPLLPSSQSNIARNREANAVELPPPRKSREAVAPETSSIQKADVVSSQSSLIPDRSLENYRLQRAISQRKQN